MWRISFINITGRLSNRKYGIYTLSIVTTKYIMYYMNDQKHRLDGPARLCYIWDQLHSATYLIHNKIYHRDGYPVNRYLHGKLYKFR